MKNLTCAHAKEENSTYLKNPKFFSSFPSCLSSVVLRCALTLTAGTAAWQRWVVQPGCHSE